MKREKKVKFKDNWTFLLESLLLLVTNNQRE